MCVRNWKQAEYGCFVSKLHVIAHLVKNYAQNRFRNSQESIQNCWRENRDASMDRFFSPQAFYGFLIFFIIKLQRNKAFISIV